MQTPKKRKRETTEVEYPRITYNAPSRTFDRLFKEDSLEEMKDVVRKKLGVANSVPIHLSQVRDSTSVDLEDDDDFDAFYAFAHASQSSHIKVVVGSDTQSIPNGDSEFSTAKKKKKKSNAIVSSSVASSSAFVDIPPQKRRRVSFVEPPGDQPERAIVITSDKKKRKHVADSSVPPEDELFDISTNEGREKKKKKKKSPATVSEKLMPNANDAETIPETPTTTKRTREEDTSQVLSPSQPADEEDDASQPAKKSKTKRKQTDDEPIPPEKSSRSKSVPPSSKRKTLTVDLSSTVPSVDPEVQVKSKKGKETSVSEPSSAAAPSSPEQVRRAEVLNVKSKKEKSKVKADDSPSVDPLTTTKVKAAQVKKNKVNLAPQETQSSDSEIPDRTINNEQKAAEGPQATLPTPKDVTTSNEKELDGPSSALVEPKIPRTRRKSQDVETSKPSKSRTAQEQSLDYDSSREHQRAAAIAAIQEILERKGITTSASPQVPQAAAPQPAQQVATSEGEEELPAQEEEPCPLCDGLPIHDRPLCPVIKGGVRSMRRRVAQLEKDTSGDETKKEKRQQVIAELQVIIQKRSRKPKTATNGAVAVEKASVRRKKDPPPATPALIAEGTKTAKQVDVISPPTPVVDVAPPIASSQPVKSTLSTRKPLKSVKQPPPLQPPPLQPPPLQPPPAFQQPSSSQKPVAKTTQDKVTTEKLMANLPFVTEPSLVGFGDLPFEDLSQVDLQSIIHGRRMSIADVPSSDEEEDEEEPFSDEEEPQQEVSRRLSQGSLREYPSSSDAEEEEDSPEGSVSKHKATSLSTEEEDPNDDRQISEVPLPPGEGNTSFREMDTRGSSREIDKTGDDAVEAALAEDFATLNAAINRKRKGPEVDSDTAVGSQVEEIDLQLKEKKIESTMVTADPIEISKEPSDEQPELIVSDDDHPAAQSTPKVESIIRTRSQRKKDTEQLEDSVVQTPKTVKKAKKITELPVPSFPSVRVMKSSITRRVKAPVQQDHEAKTLDDDVDDRPPKPSTNGKVGSRASIKDTKWSTSTKSKATASETSKGKSSAGSWVSTANGAASKPKSLYKITPTEPIGLVAAINRASEGNNNIIGSQWAVLEESNPLTETPGQVDELFSDFTSQVYQTPMANQTQDREPLFLPSETQQSYRYSQVSEIFTPRGDDAQEPSHESDDENEVLASVVKPAHPVRTYRSLSQIASSQTFTAPNFQLANSGKTKEPESLYGRNRRDVVSETDSSSEQGSESDEDGPVLSHIPASRRAGLPTILQK